MPVSDKDWGEAWLRPSAALALKSSRERKQEGAE